MAKTKEHKLPLALRRELDRAYARIHEEKAKPVEIEAIDVEIKQKRRDESIPHRDSFADADARDRKQYLHQLSRHDRLTGKEKHVLKNRNPAYSPSGLALEPAPQCEPGDCRTAQRYVDEINRVLAVSAYKGALSQHDRSNLHALRSKWRRRADGKDMRFMLKGNRVQGRMSFSSCTNRYVRDQKVVEDILGLLSQEGQV